MNYPTTAYNPNLTTESHQFMNDNQSSSNNQLMTQNPLKQQSPAVMLKKLYVSHRFPHESKAKTVVNKIMLLFLGDELYKDRCNVFFNHAYYLFSLLSYYHKNIQPAGINFSDFQSGGDINNLINAFGDQALCYQTFNNYLEAHILFSDSEQEIHTKSIKSCDDLGNFFSLISMTVLVNQFREYFVEKPHSYEIGGLCSLKTFFSLTGEAFTSAQNHLYFYLLKFHGIKKNGDNSVNVEFQSVNSDTLDNHFKTGSPVAFIVLYKGIIDYLWKTLFVRLSRHSLQTYVTKTCNFVTIDDNMSEMKSKFVINEHIPFISAINRKSPSTADLKEMGYEAYYNIIDGQLNTCYRNFVVTEHEDQSVSKMDRKNVISLITMILCYADKYRQLCDNCQSDKDLITLLTLYLNRNLVNLVVDQFAPNYPLHIAEQNVYCPPNSIDESIFHYIIDSISEDEDQYAS